MKKSIMLCAAVAAMLVSSCSQNNENESGEDVAKTGFVVKFDFGTVTKAAQSTAVPTTSWANIQQMQLFLYDADNVIRFSDVIIPTGSNPVVTLTDVPVGTYTMVAIANADAASNAITTYVDGGTTPEVWNRWNVRQKQAQNMVMKHKAGAFPTFCSATLVGEGKSAFAEPSEIFRGLATSVVVDEAGTNAVSITLKREVSLMRFRLNVNAGEGTDNTTIGANGVDFAQSASIMIHRLPDNMNVRDRISTTSAGDNIQSISTGNVFLTSDPSTGYAPATILGGDFTLWRDVVVFPNGTSEGTAVSARQYFIVVSGQGKTGHKLADGTTLTAPAPVYWSGLVKENFIPNVIREVNLTLRSGGTTDVPVDPKLVGDLTITVSAPAAWDSNIVASDIIL